MPARSANSNPEGLMALMDSLADPTRLRLLRLLERRELGVAELCEVLQSPQSTVSRHLKLLSQHGWITSRRHGTTNLYSMLLDEMEPAGRKLWLLAREQLADWPATEQDQLRLKQVLRQRQGETRRFFAGAAGQWDQIRQELYGSAFSRSALMALLPASWTVADLGCGTGLLTAELAAHVQGVIGIDQSQEMLDSAKHRCAGMKNVTLKRGELEAMPVEDAVCDAALLLLVLTYVDDPQPVLAETRRILRPGGRAVVVDLLEHDREDFRRQMGQQWPGFGCDRLTEMLTDAGFDNIKCQPLPPEPNTKGPALLLASAA